MTNEAAIIKARRMGRANFSIDGSYLPSSILAK